MKRTWTVLTTAAIVVAASLSAPAAASAATAVESHEYAVKVAKDLTPFFPAGTTCTRLLIRIEGFSGLNGNLYEFDNLTCESPKLRIHIAEEGVPGGVEIEFNGKILIRPAAANGSYFIKGQGISGTATEGYVFKLNFLSSAPMPSGDGLIPRAYLSSWNLDIGTLTAELGGVVKFKGFLLAELPVVGEGGGGGCDLTDVLVAIAGVGDDVNDLKTGQATAQDTLDTLNSKSTLILQGVSGALGANAQLISLHQKVDDLAIQIAAMQAKLEELLHCACPTAPPDPPR